MESEQALFERFIRNECTRQEIEELLAQFENAGNEAGLRKMILEQLNNEEGPASPELPDLEEKEEIIYAALMPHLKEKRTVRLWPRIAAAASILLFLSISAYYIFHKQPQKQIAQVQKPDLQPGTNQATLTLAGGRKIVLTANLHGQIAMQGNTKIQANAAGAIAYNAFGTETQIEYNTLSTKRGQQSPVPLVLADGTKIWLNAASSITFPTAFTSKNRTVNITGEVYFEVVHNESGPPLKIVANGQVVEDIGTKFNINAYEDEPVIKTTLFEGSVKLSAGASSKTLKPGQQAQVKSGEIVIIPNADTEQAIAWHKGLFKFDDADIPTVMRQLSRWYDVDISYENNIPDRQFSGKIYRNLSALKISDILNYNNIHFRIEGKKIIVEP